MLWSTILTVLSIIPCILASPTTQRRRHTHGHAHLHKRSAGQDTYTVVAGDYGYLIAAVYSITFSTLQSVNPNVNWGNLQIGQVLNMPSDRQPEQYMVNNGDTLSGIARAYNVYADDLTAANPQASPSPKPGSLLRVPGYGQYTTYKVRNGDTGNAISQAFGITFNSLSAANPGVTWTNLQIGQMLHVPAGVSPTYGNLPSPAVPPSPTTTGRVSPTTSAATITTTVKSTTTITSTTTILNPPKSSTTTSASRTTTTCTTSTSRGTASTTKTSSSTNLTTVRPTTATTTKVTTTTTIVTSSKPTTTNIITTTSTKATAASGEPNVTPTTTVSGANYVTGGNNNEGVQSRADSYTFYKGDGSIGAGWPAMSQWISFSTMWNNLLPYIGSQCQSLYNVPNNSAQENAYMYDAIQAVASNSGIDHRLILATIIQESSGCVRVRTTVSPDGSVTNPGLMQDFNGSGSCNHNGNVQTPCPASQIFQMIEDGTFGTSTDGGKTYNGGLVSDMNAQSGYSGAQANYRTARTYNSGSVPSNNDLGGPGATRCYASDMANRLMGWIGAPRTCTLDG